MKCPYFYTQYKKGQCRCIQDLTGCQDNTNNCEHHLGRQAYEADLWEESFLGKLKVIWYKIIRNLC